MRESPAHELKQALYNDRLIIKWLWKMDYCTFNNLSPTNGGFNKAEKEFNKELLK